MERATAELGFVTNHPDRPERDLAFWAYYLRDTGGRAAQRAEMDSFLAQRKAERTEDHAAGRDIRRIVKVPDDFMFFLRTLGLLRGLATSLEVRVPYLELLCLYARRALLREQLGLPPVGPALSPQPAGRDTGAEAGTGPEAGGAGSAAGPSAPWSPVRLR